MPKSGTWYCRYFFHFLQHLLRGSQQIPVAIDNTAQTVAVPELGLDVYGIFHAAFPGFDSYHGPLRRSWEKLQYHLPGYDMFGPAMSQQPETFLPSFNPNAKYVYLYRNPLDQTVSFFHHGKKHRDQTALLRRNTDGSFVTASSGKPWQPGTPSEFFDHNIENYLKQYLTWKTGHESFPAHIKLLRYESLVRQPEATFQQILDFFEVEHSTDFFNRCFQQALTLSAKDNIQAIEERLGRPLGDDQLDQRERHVRDGKIGKWRTHFSMDDFSSLTERLSSWGIDVKDFTFD